MIPAFSERPDWLKSRGYLHITPKIDVFKKYKEIYTKVNNETFVAKHGFFPLIHSVIKERKYKKIADGIGRAHSYKKDNEFKRTAKQRPLHYATHIDSIIFGCYAEILLEKYENKLKEYSGLTDCVIAYRKIEIEDPGNQNLEDDLPGKSTIHFAHEAFKEIENRSINGCVALMFDIKSFFSELNHKKLKQAWCNLLNVDKLNKAHFNVFNATTEFRYILKNDLRLNSSSNGKRRGFDEKKLASIRKHHGIEAFFESVEDFRNALKNKNLKVYKHPFMKNGRPVGIPQGLPISAVLANLYLLEFDKVILDKIVNNAGGFYRRYSDDIMIVCKQEQAEWMEKFVLDEIKNSKVEISVEKTEKYFFDHQQISPRINRITSTLLVGDNSIIGKPLTYLGFEFYGYRTLIKSANLAKYYRRLISSVKRKGNRALKIENEFDVTPAIFPRQLRKIYNNINLDREKVYRKRNMLVKNEQGFYSFEFKEVRAKLGSSYFTYTKRASEIMEQAQIAEQTKRHKAILYSSMARHLNKR